MLGPSEAKLRSVVAHPWWDHYSVPLSFIGVETFCASLSDLPVLSAPDAGYTALVTRGARPPGAACVPGVLTKKHAMEPPAIIHSAWVINYWVRGCTATRAIQISAKRNSSFVKTL